MQPSSRHVLVDIEVPADVPLGQTDMQQLVRASAYIELYRELYRRGVIGSGQAAALLGLDRSAFLDLLSAHGVSWLDDTMDVAQEAKNAQP
jgi:predicted HTH domain antitoxin